jgi:Flp pilus assembly protein TadD
MALAMVKISRSPTPLSRVRVAALILGAVGAAIAASSVPVSAQVQAYRETPAAALDRNIRLLAKSPKDFLALIAAGKAALALGDAHAAVGFFGRADEVHPASPLPHIGMGAASVADGDAQTALRYFARAQQLGANAAMMGAERGLAYDLIGRHSEAQGDYRAAMFGSDADEARRRLALSQAITGDKAGALATLAPLISRYDAGATRSRAFVLALSGDLEGARRTLDAAMPGSSVRMAPFLVKLPTLRSDQKAAAVNLGIFPATGGSAYAYVPQPSAGPAPAPAQPAPLRTRLCRSPCPSLRRDPSRPAASRVPALLQPSRCRAIGWRPSTICSNPPAAPPPVRLPHHRRRWRASPPACAGG